VQAFRDVAVEVLGPPAKGKRAAPTRATTRHKSKSMF
jgi:hypothetical protein